MELICFQQPDMDGNYFDEADYRALYQLAPNIQAAFEGRDAALSEARKEIGDRIAKARDTAQY